MKGKGYAWTDGWYMYMNKTKRADGTRCRWWMYPRFSLAYHMLETLVIKMLNGDAGTCLMMRLVGKGRRGQGKERGTREVEGLDQTT